VAGPTNDEAAQFKSVIQRIADVVPDIPIGDAERTVRTIHAHLDDARVGDFLALPIERGTREVPAHQDKSLVYRC
jgi:hypothetical protein